MKQLRAPDGGDYEETKESRFKQDILRLCNMPITVLGPSESSWPEAMAKVHAPIHTTFRVLCAAQEKMGSGTTSAKFYYPDQDPDSPIVVAGRYTSQAFSWKDDIDEEAAST